MQRSSTHNPPPLQRQNGRLQACDPCRIRKVSCDHALPVCGRCLRKSRQRECKYTASEVRPRRLTKRISRTSLEEVRSTEAVPSILSYYTPPPNQTRVPNSLSACQQHIPPVTDPGSGYLGSLSHSTVYEEAKNRLSTLHSFQISAPLLNDEAKKANYINSSILLTPSIRDKWITVLRSVPRPSSCTIRLLTTPNNSGGWVRVAAHQIIRSLDTIFGQSLGTERSDAQLERIAQVLTENTLKPLSEDNTDANSWIAGFNDHNLRWESIGLLFIFRKNGVLELSPDGTYEEISLDISRTCLELCIELSRIFSSGSSLLLFLLSRKTIMESTIMGYASLSAWRLHADTVALLTFLGIHTDPQHDSSQPNFCQENRKQLAAFIFMMDQTFVMFTGRPPLINYRFMFMPLPLDIDDGDFFADEAVVTRSFDGLDANGWNTHGGIYSVSFIRARTICAFIRAELVEVALNKASNISTSTLLDIKSRQISAMRQIPSSLIYKPREILDPKIPSYHILAQLLVQLDHLQNIFILERLLLRQKMLDEGDLLVTSFEMVSLTLTFWSHKDRLLEARNDFEWLLIAYAAPGGGIMCMELLEPTFTGTHPKNDKITRASIIQQLSMLVAFLDWVHPPAPNADLCANCKAVIQHVLDHTLNTTIESTWPPPSLDSLPLDFNFELLDTFSWARG
ncbi:hypothetical protein THAR02_01058 [Trichoderma harzianum]|uniref:Zn(2)-C6 fungal-type domain-containing protein n=1 Tax=Trichoderma harzianum TaxID=5544 RepID=A0A0F9XQG7_TRIHA|nr:hypothetical protein THAR02_01058 [Trichoderma harzianum]